MRESRGLSYAVVLAAAFTLWIPVALFGGQGFSSLLALAALPALFFVKFTPVHRLVIALLILAIWSALSSLWSAESAEVVTGDLSEGDFSIGAAGLRIILTVLAGSVVAAACLRLPARPVAALGVIAAILGLHGLIMLSMGLCYDTALALYAPTSDPVKEAPQNILRSANAFFLALPVLAGIIWRLAPPLRYFAIAATALLSALTFRLVGSDVALFGLCTLAGGAAAMFILPRSGFKVLFSGFAIAILFAPIVLGTAAPVVVKSELPLSASSKSRVFAWSLAARKVEQRPITGHGIEASKEWRETFADEPELLALMKKSTDIKGIPWKDYRILPGHPHNMGLQLWAETGLIGVLLTCTVLLLLAFALPPPAALGPPAALAAGGLTGATFALFNLSYSLWNEAFWATVVLAAAAVILLHRVTQRA